MPLEKMLRPIVLSGIFLLPFIVFIVSKDLYFPFITGKNFAFRIIVEITTGAWLALAIVNNSYWPRRSWLMGAFALFVLVVAVADAQGVYPFKSFWSNYERMDGWITQAHLFAYFVVAFSVLSTEKLWRYLWELSLGISVFVAVFGFLQIAGSAALGYGGEGGFTARIDATFGNPIYLAAYMLFHVFIAAMLWARSWKEAHEGMRTMMSVWYGAVILFDAAALFFTGTRGTILGLVGGVIVAVLAYAFFSRSQTAFKYAAGTVLLIVVLSGGILLLRGTPFVKTIGFLDRLSTISLSENTVKARFLNWGMAWKGAQERPILGWGQENYAIVFDKYYDPRMYAQEQWFDRVHNIILDWLVTTGFVGLFSYLSILGCALWYLLKRHVFDPAEQSMLVGLLAAYFFHNLFVFDNITSYVLFITVLAFIAWRVASKELAPSLVTLPINPAAALPAVVGIFVLTGVASWYLNQPAYAANKALIRAIAPSEQGLTQNLENFKKSFSYQSYGSQEAREQLIQGAAQLAPISEVPADLKESFARLAVEEMTIQERESPLDARFPLFLGVLHDAYGDYESGKTALERALGNSPTKQTILYQLGTNAFRRGDNAAALTYFKQAYDLLPENQTALLYYAQSAVWTGNESLARELIASLLPDRVEQDKWITEIKKAR